MTLIEIDFKFERFIKKHIKICQNDCDWRCPVANQCLTHGKFDIDRKDEKFVNHLKYLYQNKIKCPDFKKEFPKKIK
jgi:hypothetical protein